MQDRNVHILDLGLMDYQQVWDIQTKLHQQVVSRKRNYPEQPQEHYFILCEHPPVFTLGKSGSMDHLKLDEEGLAANEIQFYKINRGGDITHHGPGQLVGYPILDLDEFFTDVHRYVRTVEQMIIDMLTEHDIIGERIAEYTGVWLPGSVHRKICAIGVHLSRWVTMHGFALNVNNNLDLFDHIIPCGIVDNDKTVTSMAKEKVNEVSMDSVKDSIVKHFSTLFEADITYSDLQIIST